MSEHTPTPWELIEATEHHGAYVVNGWGRTVCDLYAMSNPMAASVRNGGTSFPVPFDDMAANAAFIVKAVNSHEALLEFFKWAMREGPWDGGDLDGASVQDKAESLGLIVKTQYDAEKHGIQSEFEDGDDWFEYAPHLRSDVSGAPAREGHDV
jgi:hypothetical protein